MSAQHTPGPWMPFILDKPLSEIPAYVEKCIRVGTSMEFFFVAADMPDGAVNVCHVGNGPCREANARLIAAAPELLAAVRVAEHTFRHYANLHAAKGLEGGDKAMRNTELADRMAAAIAKAEGGAA